ncbi:LamG-like jellyroll fold domain-containing protein [Nesterenkonia sp. HG001]|uniref:LamG-like jellyroll fold domain-containing protein n=1 Tax=Nesterenkonia sp. HG001 TaxID=2983207 RepID=UPI002AC4EA13|nr:glycoside hydrolase family 43 C-terminal domain-containing protein [Nesterenkonia sp. HG001]MDZ5078651.1 family 43 glycosylhydrolase [Nesterenkonia sp. HG001]
MTTRSTPRSAAATTLAAALTLTLAPSASAAPPGPDLPDPPAFTEVTVHDPALVAAGDEHWVFGSHLAAARTEDFIDWEQTAHHVTPENPLFEDVTQELAETLEWAESDTLWAPDVVQLPDGRFAMYYNACRGDSPRSAMGVAIADEVDGPYEDQGIILRSGHREGEGPSEDGTAYDGTVHPNVVDPDIFYDEHDDLWMVYGSYSGGIFLLELDETTGLPKPDQGYGTHLMGGNHSRIEAPNMMFDEESGYYYLFTTFGGLDADGGYNMRVARAEEPAGPYYDAEGHDMREVKSDPELPIFDDESIEPYGTKLMGNFLFQRELGDPGAGEGVGYVSPGHSTSHLDPETGRMHLIFHSRFPGEGERHHVRTHEMHMNSQDWPVVAPYRYAGAEAQKVYRPHAVGDYRLIDHGKAISDEITRAVDITLERNGRISGDVEGRWKLTGQHRAELTIDDETYHGVFTHDWDPTTSDWVLSFSVLSSAGVSLWGSQLEPMSDEDVVAAIRDELPLHEVDEVLSSLELPRHGSRGAQITWTSSDESIITADGDVTRPEPGSADAEVTLHAEITLGDHQETARFDVVVPARPEPGMVAHYRFDGDLSSAEGSAGDAAGDGVVTGDRIEDLRPEEQASFTQGVDGQALQLDGDSGIRLPDGLISDADYALSFWVQPATVTPYTTTFFGARSDTAWVSLVPDAGPDTEGRTALWSGSAQRYLGDAGEQLPVGEWTHVAFTVEGGAVEVLLDGELAHSGEDFPEVFTTADGVFALGVNWWDTPFHGAIDDLRVFHGGLDTEELAELATR